jgi:NADPH-dependent 2,4-dienoyl-CoA reductase/sulfur reductase-like enzyme/rhodanese-related sulfurtransferase
MDHSDFVIIGGVACGPKTASVLARRLPGASITLFQREKLASYATCGMPYYASGDIESFDALAQTSYDVIRDSGFFKTTKGFDLMVEHEVAGIDRKDKIVTVKSLTDNRVFEYGYGKLVIATGSTPNNPMFPVAASSKIRQFTRPDDALQFRESAQTGQVEKAVVVGAGFIGCEVAEATAGLWGIETILVEREQQVLPYSLDAEMAAIVEREFNRQDVKVITGASVEGIELNVDGNPVVSITGQDPIDCDYVFLCMGVRPASELARGCGLVTGESGGIVVDSRMQTSDQDIYAGGDCVENTNLITGKPMYLPMGSVANRHGRVIAENLSGHFTDFPGVVGAFLVKVFDINVGSVGLSRVAAETAGIETESVWGSFPDKPDYYPEYRTFSVKMVYRPDGRLVGLQAAGKGDICRRIDVFSAMLTKRSTLNDLLEFEHGYAPPYSEAIDPLHHLASLAVAGKRGVNIVGPDLYSKRQVTFLDVREDEEMKGEPWPAGMNQELVKIPLNELRNRCDELDSGKKIYLVCRRGPRSYQAAHILREAGFKDVHIIGGGIQAVLL